MTDKQRRIIAELEMAAKVQGLEHHLEAARSLAAHGIDPETIEGMMRFMFSRTQIAALIAEARTRTASVPLAVIR